MGEGKEQVRAMWKDTSTIKEKKTLGFTSDYDTKGHFCN